jgi:hypothetical protein
VKVCETDPLIDPAHGDFRPKPDAVCLAGLGARSFVPWGLYGVVGEWNFHPYTDEAKPVVFGEHMNFTDEHIDRYQYGDGPSNPLDCKAITRADFIQGPLENWTADALNFNGRDAYCLLTDQEIKRSVDYRLPGGKTRHFDGATRKSLDMGTSNFLIEMVFKPESGKPKETGLLEKAAAAWSFLRDLVEPGPGKPGGSVLLEKSASAGYRLRLNENGCPALDLITPRGVFTGTASRALEDGRWYHLLVEVDRAAVNGVRMYLDGAAVPCDMYGVWPQQNTSLANTNDFYVARGAAGNYFRGAMDFLRVSRGTLADALTGIKELYAWEFQGPMTRDFVGRGTESGPRSAGAIDGTPSPITN